MLLLLRGRNTLVNMISNAVNNTCLLCTEWARPCSQHRKTNLPLPSQPPFQAHPEKKKRWMWNRHKGNNTYRNFTDSLSLLNACSYADSVSVLPKQRPSHPNTQSGAAQDSYSSTTTLNTASKPEALERPNLYWHDELQPQRSLKMY